VPCSYYVNRWRFEDAATTSTAMRLRCRICCKLGRSKQHPYQCNTKFNGREPAGRLPTGRGPTVRMLSAMGWRLFVAEGDHGIYLGGAAGWDVAGCGGYGGQDCACGCQRDRIGGA
jgi:hypothetical protein